jgi:trans-2,3-dihydro-3-hydroxyanthranilate isomerase
MRDCRTLKFVQLDVFTSRRLQGNPLAVFPDARSLASEEMQAIAREMNLSETTFIVPRDPETEREEGVRVRIFTVAEELPFAGHPTLGTAAVIRAATGADEVRLQLDAGMVPVSFRQDDEGLFGEMRQQDPRFGATHTRAAISAASGVPQDYIAADLPVQTVTTGLPFTIVPVRDAASIRKLRVNVQRAEEYLKRTKGGFFYWVARESTSPWVRLFARMLFYGGEDPATGSAAGCCAAWAVKHGVVPPGESALIDQGTECGRPSRLFVRAERDGNQIVNVRVGGHVVEVARGELFL